MLTTALYLLSLLRALAEVAGMSLLGQGVLWLLTGGGRQRNAVYQMFSLITRPLIGATRRLAPKVLGDRFIPPLTFCLLFFLWITLAYVRRVVCLANVCG